MAQADEDELEEPKEVKLYECNEGGSVEITSPIAAAFYGVNTRFANVTDLVNETLIGRGSVPITNHTMGGDPSPGVGKHFHALTNVMRVGENENAEITSGRDSSPDWIGFGLCSR